ncbi:hypothetical protein F5Y14DRAFT_335803 [Nemania sp. NC0429]|nr:hypothetical protein F5Y14DRAFT_335803 [Nemania sp. NC0429]
MVYVRPRKGTRRGPKEFPGSRRKRCDLRVPPAKTPVRIHVKHTREFKIDVLLWLINNRVAVTEASDRGGPWIASGSAARKSLRVLTDDERKALKQAFRKNGVIYRPPTLEEGGIAWDIGPKSTVSNWWDNRQKFLSPRDYERSNNLPAYEVAPGAGIPPPAPEPQASPEDEAATDDIDAPDDGNDEDDDDHNSDKSGESDVVDQPPPTTMEISDLSDGASDDDESDDDDSELAELEAALNEEVALNAQVALNT